MLHTPTKVRSDDSNVDEQQCRILESYHDAFISSSIFGHNRNHNELTVSCEDIGRDLVMEEEDLLPPTLARLWSYNDGKVAGMNQSINQVADSLIPEIDDDGISESSPDVLVQECINDDSYEVQVVEFILPEIDEDGISEVSPDLLNQCINDDSNEVERILLEIKSSASGDFEPGVEIAKTPPKRSAVFDCDLSPVSVNFEIVPTPPTTESQSVEEEATVIRANAMALLERADRVDSHAFSPVGPTTTQIAPAVSCSLTADSTISIDGATPPSSMIRPQICDSQQEIPSTATEFEESCSVFTSLFGTAGPPSPSPSILISSADEDIHIGDAEPESFECAKRTTSKVITPVRFDVKTVESAVSCSLTADSSISIDDATPPSSVIRRPSCDSQQRMPSIAIEIEESCTVLSFLFGTCSPPSPSPSILISSADEDIGIDAYPESFECVLHEFLNGKRSVTKITPSASPSRETIIKNLSPIRPPHVGRILDVGANFNPAKQQADIREVAVSGGKVRVKNDLSWIKKT